MKKFKTKIYKHVDGMWHIDGPGYLDVYMTGAQAIRAFADTSHWPQYRQKEYCND